MRKKQRYFKFELRVVIFKGLKQELKLKSEASKFLY